MKMARFNSIPYISLKRKQGRPRERPRTRFSAGLKSQGSFKIRRSSGQQAIWYEEYRLSAREWLFYTCAGIGLCALIVYTFYRNFLLFLISLPLALLLPIYEKKNLKVRRMNRLKMEFKEGILMLSASLSAGYSVENAFANSVKELSRLYGEQGLLTVEFSGIVGQLRMNRPVEQALEEFAERSGLDDVRDFASVFAAAKKSGGELVAIISHTVHVIQDKISVQQEIMTMTAAKRMEQRVMNLIPFFLVFYIDSTSPGFFSLMYETALGRVIMTICLIMYLGAYALSEKILNVEV